MIQKPDSYCPQRLVRTVLDYISTLEVSPKPALSAIICEILVTVPVIAGSEVVVSASSTPVSLAKLAVIVGAVVSKVKDIEI